MDKRQLAVMGLAAAMATAPATAQDREADWLKQPTPGMLKDLYPTAAARKGADGRAVISCIVTVQGTLRACTVREEAPADLGFGAAALALAPQLLFKPALKDGKPVEGGVSIPINWKGMGAMRGAMPAAKGDKVYTNLPWRSAPTLAEVRAAYPAKARAAKVDGVAVVDCKIGKDGRLSQCNTVRENPRNHGFATAARSLAPLFVAPIDLPGGDQLVGARAHVNVTYAAASLDENATVIGKPKWIGVPRINDMAAVAPEAAKAAKIYKARVVMNCSVVAHGAVDGCTVMSQEPSGLGYDHAAISLSKYFRLAVWTEEGVPTIGGTVTIPLRFDLESVMTAAAAEAPPPKP